MPAVPLLPSQSVLPSRATWLVAFGALLIAALSARPYAGGWNDGSRLAAVECLGDRHTFVIDASIFCKPSADTIARGCPPYAAEDTNSLENGTRDKLLIEGHFYSDKPAVISLLMAGLYKGARGLGLPAAADRPDLFCWMLTFLTSGLAFVVAVLALDRLGRRLRLPAGLHLLWLSSFALSTAALAYTRHVNNHILLLAVVALLCEQMAGLGVRGEPVPWGRLALLGTLAGLGFNLDFGSGPLLVGALFLAVAWHCRRADALVVFLLALTPWVIAGLGINHAIGGVWKPMNMVPQYSTWPGCPFTPENMTGFARHGPLRLPVYALSLLFGRRGLLLHSLPLLLLLPALARWLRRPALHAGLALMLCWCAGAWLLYAALSNNYGGLCCSVRWFIPFLAPGFWALALFLREHPQWRRDLLVLSGPGAVLSLALWWNGPWVPAKNLFLWPIVGCTLVGWWLWHRAAEAGTGRSQSLPPERQAA